MMTVNEVSKLTGVSIRALQYYDKIGLLHPAEYTEAGYRLYDDTALERLQQILLFRELEFSLKEIQSILQSPDFDRDRALDQQICLLTLKKEHIENLITFARGLKQVGGMNMDFSAFDTAKMDEYATKAKEKWQHTNAYQEYSVNGVGDIFGSFDLRTQKFKQLIGLAVDAAGKLDLFDHLIGSMVKFLLGGNNAEQVNNEGQQ